MEREEKQGGDARGRGGERGAVTNQRADERSAKDAVDSRDCALSLMNLQRSGERNDILLAKLWI